MPALPVLFVLAGLAGALWPNGQSGGGGGVVVVHLVPGPIHYDFLLPADHMTRQVFAFSDIAQHPLAEWIVVGWGARGFYTATGDYTDLKPGTVWRAMTGDASVLRVDIAATLPHGLRRETLRLRQQEYAALLRAIRADLAEDHAIAGAGLTGTDQFFAAHGRFHLFRTCNVWVSEKLAQAGLRFGRWTPIPLTVTISARLFQG